MLHAQMQDIPKEITTNTNQKKNILIHLKRSSQIKNHPQFLAKQDTLTYGKCPEVF